jgi:low affinity Fe/Cu permease
VEREGHGVALELHHRDGALPALGGQRSLLSLYSDTWQLVINTATTVLTFLAVFLMQTRRTRRAGNPAELDELLRAVQPARTRLVNLEECTDEELEALRKEFEHLQKRERERAPATFATPQGS